ncbi:MAG: MoaD/ThiS family protein [Chloroflexi bacterium]|nr:MoaD/ThiS family protein [Chloroflexota bacterium]
MKVTYRDKSWKLDQGKMTARQVIKAVGLNPESTLVSVGGKLVTEDTVLEADAEVKLIAVISGG